MILGRMAPTAFGTGHLSYIDNLGEIAFRYTFLALFGFAKNVTVVLIVDLQKGTRQKLVSAVAA